jgi:hypothetical protein
MTQLETFINKGREKDRKALETSIKELNTIITRLNRQSYVAEANRVGEVRTLLQRRLDETKYLTHR